MYTRPPQKRFPKRDAGSSPASGTCLKVGEAFSLFKFSEMEKFKKILSEEMGVADEVINMTNDVYALICESIKNKEYANDGTGTVTTSFKGCKITITYEYLNFNTPEEYKYASNGKLGYGWSVFIDRRLSLMRVQICAVSGTIQKGMALDTIQHEIEHIYQQCLSQKEFGDSLRYAGIRKDMESKDQSISKAGRIMYGCLKSEQEGYANGLYSFLMSQHGPKAENFLQKSPAWALYEEMKNILSEVKMNKVLENYLLTRYGATVKELEYRVNNFLRRIARVVMKVNYDKMSKQNWR